MTEDRKNRIFHESISIQLLEASAPVEVDQSSSYKFDYSFDDYSLP